MTNAPRDDDRSQETSNLYAASSNLAEGEAEGTVSGIVSGLVGQLELMPLLRELPKEHLRILAQVAKREEYAEQSVIVREGESAHAIYFVVSGLVSLEISAAGWGSKRIMTIGPGELLGWSAILDPIQWTATARAIQPVSVLHFSGEALRVECHANPQFGYELMRRVAVALSKRLNATRLQLLDVFGTMLPAVANENRDVPVD